MTIALIVFVLLAVCAAGVAGYKFGAKAIGAVKTEVNKL